MKINGCRNNVVKKRNFFRNSSNIKLRIKTSSVKASYINAVIILTKIEIPTLLVKFRLRLSIPPNIYDVKIPTTSKIKGNAILIVILDEEVILFKPILVIDAALF